MVVLTVVTHSNPHTVYFDQPIPQPNYIRLLSCSLYNSWYNLKKEGEIALFDDDTDNAATIIKILPGHYTLRALQKNYYLLKKTMLSCQQRHIQLSGKW